MTSFMVCKNDWKWRPLWYVRMIEVLYGMLEWLKMILYGMWLKMKSFMVCKKDWKWSPLWYVRMIENEVIYVM